MRDTVEQVDPMRQSETQLQLCDANVLGVSSVVSNFNGQGKPLQSCIKRVRWAKEKAGLATTLARLKAK